jgi:hypothetical protein
VTSISTTGERFFFISVEYSHPIGLDLGRLAEV